MRIEQLVARHGAPGVGIGTFEPRPSLNCDGVNAEQRACTPRLLPADDGDEVGGCSVSQSVCTDRTFRVLRSCEHIGGELPFGMRYALTFGWMCRCGHRARVGVA